MRFLTSSPGRTALVNDEEHLFFSGYSYLGMGHVDAFVNLIKEGIDQFGILHPSSRISNTRLAIYTELEAALSSLTQQEETVTFSSGFLAGRAVVDVLENCDAPCFSVSTSHPAISTKATMLATHWQQHLVEEIAKTDASEIILLLDSVNPLTASITDLSMLNNIPVDKRLLCVIDDSHGIGLLGKRGEGISCTLPALPNVEFVITYSLSKAFHLNGGAVSCSKAFAERLRRSAYYTASTAIAPALAYAFLNSTSLYNQQREALRKNVISFIGLIKESCNIDYNNELPFFILNQPVNEVALEENKIIISSFSYPDPNGKRINRIVLNALHTKEDLEILASVLSAED